MKELFCLVNAFINRTKSDPAKTDENLDSDEEDNELLPGASNGSQRVLASLEPFIHMLPVDPEEMGSVDMREQRRLHKALYSAGVSAALSLHKFLYEPNSQGQDADIPLNELGKEGGVDWKEVFAHLERFITQEKDSAPEPLLASLNVEKLMRNEDGKSLMKMISNEVAAAALAALSTATYRRPPTKHVEGIMCASDEPPPLNNDLPLPPSLLGSELTNTVQHLMMCPHHQKCELPLAAPNLNQPAHQSSQALQRRRRSSTHTGTPPAVDCAEPPPHPVKGEEPPRERCNSGDGGHDEEMEDPDALLRYACAAGHEDLVSLLVRIRKSTEFSQKHDSTPLMEAACGGHSAVMRALIEAGANVNALSSSHNTALIYACAAGHVKCVRELLRSGRCDLTIRNESSHDALMEAASSGSLEILEMLVAEGAVPSCVKDNADFKESPLTLAAYKGHVAAVEYLISKLPQTADREEELHTALIEASMDGHLEVAKALLKHGAPVNMTPSSDSLEYGPLTLAACGGHAPLVELLLDAKADIEEPNDEGYTPLMEAAREGHLAIVELLLNRGAKVDAKLEDSEETALTLAAAGGFKNIVELLIARGADLAANDKALYDAVQDGQQEVADYLIHQFKKSPTLMPETLAQSLNEALLCAAQINNLELVNKLLDAGAQVGFLSKEGRSTVMEFSRHGNQAGVEALLNRGASINAIGEGRECTALSLAAQHGHPDMLKYLLNHGADPTTQLKDHSTCLLEASKNGHLDCVELLLDFDSAMGGATAAQSRKTTTSGGATSLGKPTGSSAISKPTAKGKAVSSTKKASPSQTAAIARELMQTENLPTLSKNEMTRKVAEVSLSEREELAQLLDNPTGSTLGKESRAAQLFQALSSATSSYPGQDELLLTQFIKRTMVSTKKREAMSDEEWNTLSDMIQHQFRSLFPSGQVDSNTPAGHQALGNIYNAASVMADGDGKEGVGSKGGKRAPERHKEGESSTSTGSSTTSGSSTPTGLPCCQHLGQKGELTTAQSKQNALARASEAMGKSTAMVSQRLAESNSLQLNQTVRPNSAAGKQTALPSANAPTATTTTVSSSAHSMGAKPPIISSGQLTSVTTSTTTSGNITTTTTTIKTSAKLMKGRKNGGGGGQTPVSHQSTKSVGTQHSEAGVGNEPHFVNMQTDTNHDTALTLACVGGHASLASLLIKRGAGIEHRDKKGFTPLILAATGGHLEACSVLIENKCQVDAQADRTKDTALSLACSGGRRDVVELLLKAGANKEHRNISDYTPLSLAASGGFVDIIQLLLNAEAEINSRTGSKLGISPLMLSAMNGHEAATALLLENGADINAQIETNKNTALTLACFQGRSEVVRLLITYGANVEHRAKSGLTPLMEAANGGYVDVGKLLLDANADVNAAPVPATKDTALTIAAEKGHAAFVEMLVHADAQINVRNKKGATPLWSACNGGHLEAVQCLVKHGAATDLQDNRKVSPLMAAFRKGHAKVVKYLVRHVAQFPSDAECNRFVAGLTDKDLAIKCRQCVDAIVAAKAKQAEEADKAAKSLLDMLEQEEAKAQSKKRSKQRQKEKKRAKKQAKQQEEVEVAAEEAGNEAVVGVEEDEEEGEPENHSTSPNDDLTGGQDNREADTDAMLEEEEDEADEYREDEEEIHDEELDPDSFPLSSVEQPARASKRHRRGRDERVPPAPHSFNPPPATGPITSLMDVKIEPEPALSIAASKIIRRTERRRGGRNSQAASTATFDKSNKSGTSGEEGEWSRPGRKQKSAASKGSAGSGSSSKKQQQQQQQASTTSSKPPTNIPSLIQSMAKLDPDEIDMWSPPSGFLNDSSSTRRRPHHVMTVTSGAIARVIGRAGSNINAIREATGAHIEVEKMTSRREQATRQITIRGSQEAITTATWMIDRLIEDSELTIAEIVEQASFFPEAESDQPQSPVLVSEGGKRAAENLSDAQKEPMTIVAASKGEAIEAGSGSLPTSCVGGNVWQQRAAIREMQKVQQNAEQVIEKLVESKPSPDFTTPSGLPSPPHSQQSNPLEDPPHHQMEQLMSQAREGQKEREELMLPPLSPAMLAEEALQRKAPGYARPVASAANANSEESRAGVKLTSQQPSFANLWGENSPPRGNPLSPPSSLLFGDGAELETPALWLPEMRKSAIGSERKGREETDWAKAFSSFGLPTSGATMGTTSSASAWASNLFSGEAERRDLPATWDTAASTNASKANGRQVSLGNNNNLETFPTAAHGPSTYRLVQPDSQYVTNPSQEDGMKPRTELMGSSVLKSYLNSMQLATTQESRQTQPIARPQPSHPPVPPGGGATMFSQVQHYGAQRVPQNPPVAQLPQLGQAKLSQVLAPSNLSTAQFASANPSTPRLTPYGPPRQMALPLQQQQQPEQTSSQQGFIHPPPGFSNGLVMDSGRALASYHPAMGPPPPGHLAGGMGHAPGYPGAPPVHQYPVHQHPGTIGAPLQQRSSQPALFPPSSTQYPAFFNNGIGNMNSGWGTTPPSTVLQHQNGRPTSQGPAPNLSSNQTAQLHTMGTLDKWNGSAAWGL